MEWIKYTIKTDISHEDEVVSILSDLGIYSIEIQDNAIVEESIEKEGGFYEELMPDVDTSDTGACVIFYLENDDEGLVEKVKKAVSNLGVLSRDISDEKYWRDNWKEFFHAFKIGNLLIRPSWEDSEKDYPVEKTIIIDPGISFGTGSHETTRMCIEAMQKYIQPKDNVLDVGFGSGILSVAAAKLGANKVGGTDIDRDCLDSAKDNFEKNGLEFDGSNFFIGDLSGDESLLLKLGEGSYDIVLANILADIIISMDDKLIRALKPNGMLIASGIIDFKEEAVVTALKEVGFEIVEVNKDGEWVQISAKKN